MIKLTDLLIEMLLEDRCKRIADRRYSKPSAYKSGAIVRCRKGNIWKGIKSEAFFIGEDDPETPQPGESSGAAAKFKPGTEPKKIEFLTLSEIIQKIPSIPYYKEVLDDIKKGDESWGVTKKVKEYAEYMMKNPSSLKNLPPIIVIDGKIQDGAHRISAIYLLQNLLDPENNFWKTLKLKVEFWNKENLNEKQKETLRTWFKRKGAPGKTGGWVDCNTCREVDGKTKCKPCGRQKGEKRAKYPSCRPTPSQCKQPGKGTKWGKTK